ncbi:hypothetical protein A3F07_03740 [candidate division WWE3 bacterium RIFCSPHIGHO2_12_FULL_38_15]|uniref:DUF4430 domain-containing protein n=1 Tax=candidate division WWE3 bacterium RIFCSPHIGHO2_02_FULL_38_14 TaxID=1802620 RepID=A0A1F4V7T8_UNCKA|nr:MAG: hypothetical protein A2793_02240 [candidate division WWE3 bacterium RIFCSPHIGHO2_01_FULL_38_45]OGC48932.1 MAG: hypothetical protein A3F07_03740 [candidate division WWE3 bacterium RIFCSPHIGHO2_12_FULL_38_15]OGC52961.1 MAG: hypothetical protein A3B64_04865 [candidate division WWE3 bacterium RIFCSPLOWO2_01_FULL_37_24]OGC53238.1 MAG: hypothetical protein A3D91_02335 [candidate division WWE3 bacterium RIFCSPHIGHO2_02_FULL_38_14]
MLKKILIAVYLLSLIFGIYFVQNALKINKVPTGEIEKKKVVEVHPAQVTLKVLSVDGTEKTYKVKMKNIDTVLDLFEDLRNKQSFYYEKIAYIYGTEINSVNGINAPESFKWHIYTNDEDITFKVNEFKLEDNAVYELKLVKS